MTETPEKPEPKYWAACDDTKIAQHIADRVEKYDATSAKVSGLATLLNAYRNFFGVDLRGLGASTSYVSRAGEQGEEVAVRVNSSRAFANAKHQIVVGPKVSWVCTSANSDYRSMADTVLGAKALEYYWKERGIEQLAVDAELTATWAGEDFLFTPWDTTLGDELLASSLAPDAVPVKTGDVAYHPVPTWDVIRDPNARSWEELSWYVVRLYKNKYDVAALYPEQEEKILNTSPTRAFAANELAETFGDSEFIPVLYFFHKRTPGLPRGRQSVSVGTTKLEDGFLDYKRIPVHRLACGNLKNTPYAYTNYWEVLGIQELSDGIHSALATNITTCSGGILSAEEGSNLPVAQLGGNGPKVVYRKPGSQAPVPLQFPQSPKESFNHVDRLKGDMREQLGLNSVAMGQPDTAQMNAQAFALLASMAVQANSSDQGRYVEFIRSVGRSTIEILQAKASYPRKIALAGINSKGFIKPQSLSGKDIKAVDDVIVEIGNPLQQTAAGRLQIAQLNVKEGFVKNPEQLAMVLETGRLDPQTQAARNKLLLIVAENEDLAKGIEPEVSVYDDPHLHAAEHSGLLADPDVRRDPKATIATQNHIRKHWEVWKTTDPEYLAFCGITPPMAMPPVDPASGEPLPPDAGGPPPPGLESPSPGADAGVDLPGLPVDPNTGEPPPVAGANGLVGGALQ